METLRFVPRMIDYILDPKSKLTQFVSIRAAAPEVVLVTTCVYVYIIDGLAFWKSLAKACSV